jgi:mono/diheme cytochrome c family protein
MMRSALYAAAALIASTAHVSALAGDPAKGEQLHRACLGCHGTELYSPPQARVKSLTALKKEVVKWNDRMNPKFTKKEIDDLVAYLNRDFYHLSR